jgi:hypothetical protein
LLEGRKELRIGIEVMDVIGVMDVYMSGEKVEKNEKSEKV